MEDRPVLVTAAVIVRDGKVLLDRRRADSKFEPLRWEFPGGKVEFGESLQGSLMRELYEELGIRSEIGPLIHHVSHVHTEGGRKRHLVIFFFECTILDGVPRAIEVGEVGWFDRQTLTELELVQADVPLKALVGPRLS